MFSPTTSGQLFIRRTIPKCPSPSKRSRIGCSALAMRSGGRYREVFPIINNHSDVDRLAERAEPVDTAMLVLRRFSESTMGIVSQWIADHRRAPTSLAGLNRFVTVISFDLMTAKLWRRVINSYYVVLWIHRRHYRLCFEGDLIIS